VIASLLDQTLSFPNFFIPLSDFTCMHFDIIEALDNPLTAGQLISLTNPGSITWNTLGFYFISGRLLLV